MFPTETGITVNDWLEHDIHVDSVQEGGAVEYRLQFSRWGVIVKFDYRQGAFKNHDKNEVR